MNYILVFGFGIFKLSGGIWGELCKIINCLIFLILPSLKKEGGKNFKNN